MNFTLTRYGSMPNKGTFGEISVAGNTFYTIEREWLDNKPFVSCIPTGMYQLEPHSSRKYGETWALVNEQNGVFHYDNDNPDMKRYTILLHPANWQKDLQGCIGIGKSLGDSWNVTSSRDAMENVLALMAHEDYHTLLIKNAYNSPNRRLQK